MAGVKRKSLSIIKVYTHVALDEGVDFD